MSAASGPPPSAASLRQRVANVARKRGTTELRITVAVCNTVIGQMLPPGVVKDGRGVNRHLEAEVNVARGRLTYGAHTVASGKMTG